MQSSSTSATTSSSSSTSPSSSSVLAKVDDNQQVRLSNSVKASSTTSLLSPSSKSEHSSPAPRRHRSVKSITRVYESQQISGEVTPASHSKSHLFLPSSHSSTLHSSNPSPSILEQERRASIGSTSSPTLETTKKHSKRASVLLASASYPSTLSTTDSDQYSRPRAVSSSSISAKDQNRSTSLKLASTAYPSSYQSNIKGSKSVESCPLPLPAMALRNSTNKLASVPSATSLPTLSVSLNDDEVKNDQKREIEFEEQEGEDMISELSPSLSPEKTMPSLTAAERRDHSRKHSRVHSRNLSVFFPRPGTEAEEEADRIQATKNFQRPRVTVQTEDLPELDADSLAIPSSSSGVSLSPSKSNRGHHRKHSVNHGLISVSQPSTNEGRLGLSFLTSSSDQGPSSPEEERSRVEAHEPVLVNALSTPVWQSKLFSSLPASHRPLLLFGALHFILGATLWTKGQSGDSLSITGLGYLVVFDAFGILNGVASEWLGGKWRHQERTKQNQETVRKPYGPHRVETVLQFSQTVFLLFAAIYVCKESVEHALLEGAEEHHEEDDVGLYLPWLMLALTTGACLFSNMILHNHDRLVAACGIATTASDSGSKQRRTRGHGRANSILVDPSTLAGPFLQLLSNPFSTTVLFFSLTLTCASLVMPPFQVAALDKVLAGLESVAMLYIAYPASKALGKILLQTAPKAFNTQNVQLLRSLKTIQDHPLVTYVAPPHLWQLTPPTSATTNHNQNGKSNGSLLGGQRQVKNASLIATVEIFLNEDANDANVLEISRWAWTLLAPAVGAGAGLQAGESLRGAIRAGEVSVQVSREGQRDRYRNEILSKADNHHHHHHDDDHSHSHSHDKAYHVTHQHQIDHSHHNEHHHHHHHHHEGEQKAHHSHSH